MAIQRKWPKTCEPNRTEPNRTEPNRTEPNRTEPNRTEPNPPFYHTVPGVSPTAGGAAAMIPAAGSRRSPRRAGRVALLTLVLAACAALPFTPTALAQTSRILVSNVSQGDDVANTSGLERAQLFQTGAHTDGYTLTSVIVVSEDAEGDAFDVDICGADTTADEFPTATCTALTAPASFTAGNLEFTHAGLALSANTNYVVVVKPRASADVAIDATTAGGEDSTGLTGWSIKNYFYWNYGIWANQSGQVLQITVNGYETEVTEVWSATLTVGEKTLLSTTLQGWNAAGDYTGAGLTDSDFTIGGDAYEISTIQLDVRFQEGAILTLQFSGTARRNIATQAVRDRLRLYVGSDFFDLGAGIYNNSYIFWTQTGLSWTASDSIELRITVTEVDEPPAAPDAPTVTATAGSTTSLDVAWTAPSNVGKPAIDHYDLQYRIGISGSFTAASHTQPGTTTSIGGLTAGTSYEVQVRAHNAEGDGPWSASGTGRTINPPPPIVTIGTVIWSATLWIEQVKFGFSVFNLGYSTDGSDDYGSLSDADFDLLGTTYTVEILTIDVEPDYDVVIRFDQAPGAALAATLTLHLGDGDVPHGTESFPLADAVVSSDGTHFNFGNSHNLHWSDGTPHSVALTRGTNAAPVFSDTPLTRSIAENTAAGENVGAVVTATDTDSGATLSYSLEGTDAAAFDIVSTSGQIQTKAALDYESKDRYSLTVKADDGKGGTDTVAVTVRVTNEDEAGTVTLTGTAQALQPLTATLSDPDGSPSSISWQWSRSTGTTCPGIAISGATAHQYTPQAADVHNYVCATATYTDPQGSGKSAAAVTAAVQAAPVVQLSLSPTTISEDGTEMSTVTATLDKVSSAVTTVTVSAPADDVTLSSPRTLTIAAGATTTPDTVTLTATPNDVDAPDKTVPVSGTTPNSLVTGPAPVNLTITDDDDPPTVTLVLSPESIREDAKVSTVTATLDHASSAETTVVVSAQAVFPAVAGDFELSTNRTLTIEAGAPASSGTAVTLTSVDNDTDAPGKQVTVRGTASNTQGSMGPADATLLLTDDDDPPTVTLAWSATQIDESGVDNSATLTVTLSHPSSVDIEVTVTAAPAAAVTPPNPLRIPAGQTVGTVTLTAVDNDIDGPETTPVTVTAAVAAYALGTIAPATAPRLTITDDDDPPAVTLAVLPTPIAEAGGVSTVTAELSHPSSTPIVVTVTEASAYYRLSPNRRLTFPPEAVMGQGTVTLEAKDNDTDAADATVQVEGATTPSGLTVNAAALTITDDDTRGVTVTPTALSIREGETDTYTVVLDTEPTEPVTVAVTVPSTAVDRVNPESLTFTSTTWETPQEVTVTAVDDAVENLNPHTDTLTHTVTGGDYEANSVPAADVGVTVTDDESPSTTVTLEVTPGAVREAGDRPVTVTGELDGAPREGATVVTLAVQAGTATAGDDFAAVAAFALTIAANAERGTATFTLTAQADSIHEPDETVLVSGTTTVGLTVTAAELTIRDTTGPPTVTLAVAPEAIREGETSQVTARLNHRSSKETEVTVVATAVPPAGDAAFTLSGTVLTIPAGQTASSGSLMLTAANNTEDEADKEVTVRGTATNALAIAGHPDDVSLSITDDDPPEVEPQTESDRAPRYIEGETGRVATYTASNPDPRNISITWSLEGADKDAFTIRNGVLEFKEPPDYEPRRDTPYEVMVRASDGTLIGTLDVPVTVTDALGTVALPAAQPQVGVALTATVSDPDGVDTTTTAWCWERSSFSTFPLSDPSKLQIDCDTTTTATYTPVDDDLGKYLRATVRYTDSQETPKAEEIFAVTDEIVLPAQQRSTTQRPGRGGGGRGGGGGGGGGPACAEDVHGNSAAQATDIALSAVTAGAICPAADVDYFTVTAPDRGLLFVDTTGGGNLRGTLWQDSVELASGPVSSSGPGARLGAFVEAGPVVVAVQGQGGAPGPYTVEITFVPGYLENPGAESFQSGVGVLSGWVCDADMVEIELNGVPQEAALWHRAAGHRRRVWRHRQRLWSPVQLESVGGRGACSRRPGRWGGVGPGDGDGNDVRGGVSAERGGDV